MYPDAILPLSTAKRRLAVGALLTGTFLASLEVMVVSPAMPRVVGEFGQAGLYPWVFTAFMLAQTLSIPFYGVLADRYGRRPIYLMSISLFVAGSMLCALASSMPIVVWGRAVQGLGAGGLIPLTLTIFGDIYPVSERTKMQGVFSLIWGISSVLGPLVGGFLTENFSWRAIFWINILPGAIAALIIGIVVPMRGAQLSMISVGQAFIRLIRIPTQQAILLSGFLLGAMMLGIIGYLPLWVQTVENGSPLDAGMALIPLSLAWTLGANISGRLVRFLDFGHIVRIGSLSIVVGTGIASFWPAHFVGFMLYGLGMGLCMSSFIVSSQEKAPQELRGTITSYGMFTRSIGGAIGVAVFGQVAHLKSGFSSFSEVQNLDSGLKNIFFWVFICALISLAIILLRFPKRIFPTAKDC